MNNIKKFIKKEFKELFAGIGKLEYAAWWLLRLGMIIVIIRGKQKDFAPFVIMLLAANLIATFSIPLVRLLFPHNSIFGRIPFRIQSYIDIFVFTGSFLGHGFEFNGTVENYDKVMHIISGLFAVFIGNQLICCMKRTERVPHSLRVFAASGFSFVVMTMWELFEFFSDYYFKDSQNQNYKWNPPEDMLFFKIFGQSVNGTDQYPVLDTNIDLLCAVIGCIIGASVLAAWFGYSEKKAQRLCKQITEEKQECAV